MPAPKPSEYEEHIEAGTCFVCKQPVLDGQARHGQYGSHWSCSENLENPPMLKSLVDRRVDDAVARLELAKSVLAKAG